MHKLVSHEYFLDEMHIVDIGIMTRYLEYADVLEWTHTRQLMLAQLKPWLKNKKLTAAELFPLPIDKKKDEGLTKEVTNEEIDWFKKIKNNFNEKQKDSK